jgi:glycosyltransferase involved in cell wall biosynthesis
VRILHVDHSPVLGGAERSLLTLARSQVALGHDVVVAVGRPGPFQAAAAGAGIPTVDLGWPRRFVETTSGVSWLDSALTVPHLLLSAALLRRAIARRHPDVIHSHTRKAHLVSSLAAAGTGVPLIWHLRDYPPKPGPVRTALRLAIHGAAHAVALATWLGDAYGRAGLLPRSGRIDRVTSSVDPDTIAGLPTPWLDGRRPPVVGYIGNVARAKGPHLIVDVAESLADLADVRFVVVGDVWFPSSDRGYGDWLRRRIATSPVANRIAWLPTRSPREAFEEVDVLIHPSIEPEPFGRVLVEALLAHRPIVAFRHGGAAEILHDEVAELTPPGDIGALAAAVRRTLADPVRTRQRTVAAAIVAAEFEPKRIAQAMDLAYGTVTA